MKTFGENRNGMEMNIDIDSMPVGMHVQNTNPFLPFSMGSTMRKSGTDDQSKVFKNGSDKSDGAGTINKNGEYGPITYGF